jgi:hypothetical protein
MIYEKTTLNCWLSLDDAQNIFISVDENEYLFPFAHFIEGVADMSEEMAQKWKPQIQQLLDTVLEAAGEKNWACMVDGEEDPCDMCVLDDPEYSAQDCAFTDFRTNADPITDKTQCEHWKKVKQ